MAKDRSFSTMIKIVPGFLFALAIAAISVFLEHLLPIHLIGASVIALFIGMFLNGLLPKSAITEPGLFFTSRSVLKFGIILLGASLSIHTILEVGKLSLIVMLFTLITCFGGGYFIGKALGLDWKLSNLISAGTGICGGSAIAAIAPVIDAKDHDIAYSMSATFLFDMVMILMFPIIGRWMGLSDMAYGLWTGTAVNDTSSVVAAGYAYTEQAGDFATMVKLTRTLTIIPTVIVFALTNIHVKRKAGINANAEDAVTDFHMSAVFPWFIIGFIALSILNSVGWIPIAWSETAKEVSKFLMIAALAAIGLNTSFDEMKSSGIAPMIHGFIISALVVIVAIGVEYFMGIV